VNVADEVILERIRRLLDMAADTSSPHEASIAAGRARKLMDQYQVDMSDLKKQSGFGYQYAGPAYRFMPVWRDILAVAIGKLNDCRVSRHTRGEKTAKGSYTYRVMYQGYESDVAVCVAMYDYLTQTIERLCKKYMHEIGHGSHYIARIGDAYKKECAHTLCQRLQKITEERQAEVKMSDGRSLVVFKMAEVEAEFGKAEYVNKDLVTRKDAETYAAQRRGREDGEKISLAQQVDGPRADTPRLPA
jgi:hypothetical protein